MSVSTSTSSIVYAVGGSPSTTVFPFPFPATSASELVVVKTLADGTTQTLAYGSGYTATIGTSSGTVTLPAALGTSGLTIARVVPLTQPATFPNEGAWFPENAERAFDRMTMQIQQQQEELNRCMQVPLGATTSTTVPMPVAAAALGWNINGTALTNLPTTVGSYNSALGLYGEGQGSNLLAWKSSLFGAAELTQANKNEQILDARDLGVVADGSTDQTTKLLNIFSDTLPTYRGKFVIPYNTKFDVETVYAACPVGVMIEDYSSINWGQPPSYKNKFWSYYSSDAESDDTNFQVASNHHATVMINNFGTAGTASANARRSTVAFSCGYRGGDPITGYFLQQYLETDNTWVMALRMQSPGQAAKSVPWAQGVAKVIGDAVYTAADRVYVATTNGTTGATEPTHTSGTASDGGVTWRYISDFIVDSTRHWFLQEGEHAHWGNAVRMLQTNTTGNRSHWIGIGYEGAGYENDIVWRDVSRGRDIVRISDELGIQVNTLQSQPFKTLSGATPTVNTSACFIQNASPTNMTNLLLEGSMTNADVLLLFADANTTIPHGGNFQLKGATSVNPPASGVMRFIKYPAHSSQWIEASRNF